MKYKTGDKFVVEIDSVMTNKKGTLYGIKGFKSLVFDEYGLDLLERVDAEDDEFHVGDEITTYPQYGTMVITRTGKDACDINVVEAINSDGRICSFLKSQVTKTGRHFDEVEKLLRKIGE